jgi:hypothetical protein
MSLRGGAPIEVDDVDPHKIGRLMAEGYQQVFPDQPAQLDLPMKEEEHAG